MSGEEDGNGWMDGVAGGRGIVIMHAEGVGDRLEVCDTDSLIKESKDSTADWSG